VSPHVGLLERKLDPSELLESLDREPAMLTNFPSLSRKHTNPDRHYHDGNHNTDSKNQSSCKRNTAELFVGGQEESYEKRDRYESKTLKQINRNWNQERQRSSQAY